MNKPLKKLQLAVKNITALPQDLAQVVNGAYSAKCNLPPILR